MKNTAQIKRKMSAFAAVLAAGAVLLTSSGCESIGKIQAVPTAMMSASGTGTSDKSIRLIAQGGLSGIAPENTAVAVEQAGREGFTAIEIDIRETLDGMWVLMRDSTVGRMTDGRGRIIKSTYFDLLRFSVDNGANIDLYPDTKIAELEDVLGLCAMYSVRPYVRVEQSSRAGLTKLAGIFSAGSDTQVFAVLSSDRELLQQVKELSPKTELWFTAETLSGSKIQWLEANKDFGVVVDAGKRANTDEKIEQVLNAGIKTALWNANSTETIDYYYILGVRTFFTNSVLPR